MKDRAWFKYFFKALIYMMVGLFILLVTPHKSIILTVIGTMIFMGGAVLMGISLISFVKWIVD